MGLFDRPSRRQFLAQAAGSAGALMLGGTVSFAQQADASLSNGMADPQAWEKFLAELDLQWKKIPRTFYEGPFLGNGGLGASVYQVANRLSFTLGHSQVRDHQPMVSTDFANARLRIGRFDLITQGDLIDVDLRLSLFDAQLRGKVTTSRGSIDIIAFVDAARDVLVVQTTPSGDEKADWNFEPYLARSPRFDFRTDNLPEGMVDNPAPEIGEDRVVQKLARGGSHTTMWRKSGDLLVATVAKSYPDDTSASDAEKTLAAAASVQALSDEHRQWWNSYYVKSFVSVPDGRIQSFYWIQLYKIASATRAGLPPIGTAAQWLEPTPWTATWWNLNVQLEYWLINATAHYELDSLTSALDEHRDNLIGNVPEKYRGDSSGIARTAQENLKTITLHEAGSDTKFGPELELGNLTWALHNVWLRYRHTMDEALLRDTLFPILRRAVNYNLHFLKEGPDGKLHMPRTYSPEYAFADDCNYTLSLLNWGCRTLEWSAKRLGIDDPLAPKWREVVEKMVEPPQGPDGLWIGSDRQLDSSHRHYSHILWFYPLYLLDVTEPANRSLLERSLAHWISFEGALQGYTFTGASSMSAMMGKGDDALQFLDTLLDTFIQPNTMYAETGPVIETPLSGAQCVHDMLITSWGDRIRVFPAAPSKWPDIAFHQLRTEGAFEVSAVRKGGKTEWIQVKSLAGEPCRIDRGSLPGDWQVQAVGGSREIKQSEEDGVITLDLRSGETAIITTAGATGQLALAPVAANPFSWGQPATPRGASTPVDLTAVYNNDGISSHDNPADGDLGNDYSLPSEELPAAGALRLGGVDWTFPSHADGAMNNLVPAGQKVDVPRGRYARLDFLGCTIPPPTAEFEDKPPTPTQITATYADGSTAIVPLTISVWDKQSTEADDVAAQVTHRHSGIDFSKIEVKPAALPPVNRAARIFHKWVDIDPGKELVSLTFADNPHAHIFALSVEAPVG